MAEAVQCRSQVDCNLSDVSIDDDGLTKNGIAPNVRQGFVRRVVV